LSAHALDDLDQLVHAVALMTGELDKLPRSLNNRIPLTAWSASAMRRGAASA
jgi:hypothetical protein